LLKRSKAVVVEDGHVGGCFDVLIQMALRGSFHVDSATLNPMK